MYAFSSKGDLTEIEYEYEGFMSDNQRLNDVGNIISKLKMAFLSNKMTYNDNGFAVILDNGIIAEDIVIFTKTPLPSNSELVKEAYRAKTVKDYIFPSREHGKMYPSIFSMETRNKTTWWLMHIYIIHIEHNLADLQIINAKLTRYGYFHELIREIKSIDNEGARTFYTINDNISDNDFLNGAVKITQNIDFKVFLVNSLNDILKDRLRGIYRNSNRATDMYNKILLFSNVSNMYGIYNDIKRFIKYNKDVSKK